MENAKNFYSEDGKREPEEGREDTIPKIISDIKEITQECLIISEQIKGAIIGVQKEKGNKEPSCETERPCFLSDLISTRKEIDKQRSELSYIRMLLS